MGALRTLWRAMAALALIGAGAVLPASSPVGDGWRADPEEQYNLDVSLHRLRLGDGVRAYQAPMGTCLILGDVVQALDVPIKIDLVAGKATGWAFRQEQTVVIDRAASAATIRGKRESIATSAIHDAPEGWCVDGKTLGRWLGIEFTADTNNSMLLVESTQTLPIEAAMERQNRASGLKSAAALDLTGAPRVRLPYRMWRAPAFEFVVNAGLTYNAGSGVRVDRSAAMFMAGELAAMSYKASASGDLAGKPQSVRATLYRADPDGNLLGPLHATNVAVGDVEGFQSAFGGNGDNGRGAMITNRPLAHNSRFDRTQFSGDLPPGWDAELYRNGALVGFDGGKSGDRRYHFDDVEMSYGENDFEIILYGPQGQEQHRRESIDVGRDNVPKGKLWYWVGARQPGTDLISFHPPPATTTDPATGETISRRAVSPGPELSASAEYGVSERLSVAALAQSAMIEDARVTFVEGAVRYSLGKAMVETAVAVDSRGKFAARAQIAAKFGQFTLNAANSFTNGFGAVYDRAAKSEQTLGVSAPLRLGKTLVPVSADISRLVRVDGSSALAASARIGAQIGRFNLSSQTHFVRERAPPGEGGQSSDQVDTELIGTARVGAIRWRGTARWDIAPVKRFENAEIEASWSSGERAEWQAALAYDALYHRGRARFSHIHRFSVVDAGFTAEAATDGSIAAGISLSFSLSPFNGNGLRPTREKLATNGAVEARVFEDLNENGKYDPGEPLEQKAMVTTGSHEVFSATDRRGEVTVGGLAPYQPIPVGIDQTSLDNPALTPAKAVQVVVPRPGTVTFVDIALVGGGSIEGALMRSDQREIEGADIELVDEAGKVVATTRSDIDGYFLFERVKYGRYSLRLSKGSAAALNMPVDLGKAAEVNRDHPLLRMGSIIVTALPKLASAN
ncbi:carboxypeptidase-like regulatory domain-containing protein [Sphingomonas sp. ASV193]|uniref:MSCRAMM family protein n=1 Tax=Sphingomonas sp. ASV193 TaxID=3144405 RepID=UPI0032E91724